MQLQLRRRRRLLLLLPPAAYYLPPTIYHLPPPHRRPPPSAFAYPAAAASSDATTTTTTTATTTTITPTTTTAYCDDDHFKPKTEAEPGDLQHPEQTAWPVAAAGRFGLVHAATESLRSLTSSVLQAMESVSKLCLVPAPHSTSSLAQPTNCSTAEAPEAALANELATRGIAGIAVDDSCSANCISRRGLALALG